MQISELTHRLEDKERQHRETLESMKEEQNKIIKRVSAMETGIRR